MGAHIGKLTSTIQVEKPVRRNSKDYEAMEIVSVQDSRVATTKADTNNFCALIIGEENNGALGRWILFVQRGVHRMPID
ncbi:hypothetical protein A7J57_08280 [Agrobacterium tumefaciens]|uniref:Uncharacterized protein n=1 Tax=Agrobacterium tumefaciens TaxID=358 RepID=A0A176WWN4_AGRTU|nr:hypothetical protein A7J57_08280 [Agrobacterium tumefaciens]